MVLNRSFILWTSIYLFSCSLDLEDTYLKKRITYMFFLKEISQNLKIWQVATFLFKIKSVKSRNLRSFKAFIHTVRLSATSFIQVSGPQVKKMSWNQSGMSYTAIIQNYFASEQYLYSFYHILLPESEFCCNTIEHFIYLSKRSIHCKLQKVVNLSRLSIPTLIRKHLK